MIFVFSFLIIFLLWLCVTDKAGYLSSYHIILCRNKSYVKLILGFEPSLL